MGQRADDGAVKLITEVYCLQFKQIAMRVHAAHPFDGQQSHEVSRHAAVAGCC